MSMVSKILNHKYPLLIFVIVLVLAFVNYTPGTWLTGWDDSHPEFNFELNISRTLNAVWREHRGLGLASGLAHSAQLFRYLFLWISSVVIPASFIRYFWQFLMLLLGPLGTFYFSRSLIYRSLEGERKNALSFLTSMFYLLNLATLQTFYVPLETFTTQYGFLPWLFLYIFRILDNPNKRNIGVFALLNIASASQAFTPTLFFAYLSFVLLILLGHMLTNRSRTSARSSLLVLLIILITNLYWLLPFSYFLANGNAAQVSEATINILSSEESFLMNKQHGKLGDLAILKGFLFSTTDFNQASSSYEWLMDKWIIYQSPWFVKYLGYMLFLFVAIGFIYCLVNKSKLGLRMNITLVLLFLCSMFFLMGDSPPLGAVFRIFQKIVPMFNEALRFPFTKYSILAGFTYSILFGLGFSQVLEALSRPIKNKIYVKYLYIGFFALVCTTLLLWMLPMFQGDLIYRRLRVKIPQEYFSMFSWFNGQDGQGRVLKLPIQTYWSWGFNEWGYRGSGFTWYGLEQPTIDRAFDVWSTRNESLYREVSYAVYSNNPEIFRNVLTKYKIEYILLDNSVYEPQVPKNAKFMGFEAVEPFLANKQDFKLEQALGFLEIYRFLHSSDSGLEMSKNLPSTKLGGGWIPKDSVYQDIGGAYISGSRGEQIVYPFSSIGNYRSIKSSYKVDLFPDSYKLSAEISDSGNLEVPDYLSKEKIIPAKLVIKSGKLYVVPILPKIFVNNEEVKYYTDSEFSLSLPANKKNLLLFSIDKAVYGPFSSSDHDKVVGTVLLDLSKRYTLTFWDYSSSKSTDLLSLYKDAEVDSCVTQDYGSYGLEKADNGIKLVSENNTACIAATKGLLADLDLFSVEYKASLENSETSYCIFGIDDCLNDKIYDGRFLLLEKLEKPFTIQFYSSPIEPDRPAISFFDFISLVQYPLISTQQVNFLDYLKPQVDKNSTKINSGKITIEIAKPLDYKKSYIYENFDKTNIKSIAHECNFASGVQVDDDFKKTLSFTKNEIQVSTVEKSSCFTLTNKYLTHNIGYLVEIPFKQLEGKDQKFCLQNNYTDRCDLIYKLEPEEKGVYSNGKFVIPAYSDGGEGYKLTIENTSIGKEQSINAYDDIGVYPFPFDFVSSIKLVKNSQKVASGSAGIALNHKKFSNFLYKAGWVALDTNQTLILDQAYDPGWMAFCGIKPCKAEHVLVNNWENGWVFDIGNKVTNVESVTVIFWPQVLEYIGLMALFGWILGLSTAFRRRRR